MSTQRVLILGSGGREHALADWLARDPDVASVHVAPGNEGIAEAGFERVAAAETDVPSLIGACRARGITLVVVGPEGPLAEGVADGLGAAGIAVFGPSRAAARLEASKWHAKEVMREAGVPTARAEAFDAAPAAVAALGRFDPPWVIKADGLAAGKGVLVTADRAAAERFVRGCLEGGRFGAGGRRIVLEEFLAGEEASVMAVCDGERWALLPAARDYKRARDGDAGPNTGGMGAVAPAPAVTARVAADVEARIVAPMLATLARRGAPFRGLLYCGLMVGERDLSVVEFNVRFGDPETQSALALAGGSPAALLAGAAAGRLDPAALRAEPGAALTVALVDEGYPDAVRGDGTITGLDDASRRPGVRVFHAATRRAGPAWRVTGGRAAYVTAVATTAERARESAYAAIGRLGGDGWRCRRDVGAIGSLAAGGR